MKIRFHPEAESEIDDAVAYYNLQREGLGRDFAREVQAGPTFHMLGVQSGAGCGDTG